MFEKRVDELEELGLEFLPKYNSYCFKDVNVGVVEIQTMSDKEWNELINEIKPIIEARKSAQK